MKVDIASLIAAAASVAKHVETGKQAIAVIREIVKRDHSGELAAFDAQVGSATKAAQESHAAAAPGTTDD